MSPFKIINKTFNFQTKGEISFIDLTDKVQEVASNSGVIDGLVHIFAPHATGVIILTENDPALIDDIRDFLESIIPRNRNYYHPSNAHSHLRSIFLPPDRTLPIVKGRVEFGTWQSLLFVETDVYPRNRKIIIQIMGES